MTDDGLPPLKRELVFQHLGAERTAHVLSVVWKDGIDLLMPTPQLVALCEAYARLAIAQDRARMGNAKEQYDACGGDEETDPLERLRAFCSFAMRGQDWLDVEPFFDDVEKALRQPAVSVPASEPVAWRALFPHEFGTWHSFDPNNEVDQYHLNGLIGEGIQIEYAYAAPPAPSAEITPEADEQNEWKPLPVTDHSYLFYLFDHAKMSWIALDHDPRIKGVTPEDRERAKDASERLSGFAKYVGIDGAYIAPEHLLEAAALLRKAYL